MKKREPYASITFTPTTEVRKKLVEVMKETEHPVSAIVLKCVEHALKKVELRSVKKDIFFQE